MTTNWYYAGIGSRKTPVDILLFFEQLGTYLANREFTLRSGHAPGADKAFETGCDLVSGEKEIFLPWKGFEGSDSPYYLDNPEAYKIAERYHPYWHNLSAGARKLQARNGHQVLGWDLKTPSLFVICWTKNGKGSGGTGQAIRIAMSNEIPIFDAGKHGDTVQVKQAAKLFLNMIIGDIESEIFT